MTESATDTSYDDVPYPGKAFPQTHPSRLAVMATLWGLTPAPVERCRVLELGCGDAGNLIPMAAMLPDATFLGLDLSPREIEHGKSRVQGLGLTNLTLRVEDILEAGRDLGQFDYVIAHGVYSWVPPAVQERVLAIFREHLAPGGVAYVSYNALPGCRLRHMLREMMLHVTRDVAAPAERVSRGRALVDFLVESTAEDGSPYASVLKETRDIFADRADAVLLHDDLGGCNEALYFHELIARASRHGLQYLAEAEFADTQTESLAPVAREKLEAVEDRLAYEQMLDFVRGQRFRRTLLCRKEERVAHPPTPDRLARLYLRASAFPAAPEADDFTTREGTTFSVGHPRVSAALRRLAEAFPRALSWPELAAATGEPVADGEQAATLGNAMLGLYANAFVELHAHSPVVGRPPGARPRATALARAEIAVGTTVTDPWHATVDIDDEMARELLLRLDGTRDRAALVRDLVRWAKWKEPPAEVAAFVDVALARLANHGLIALDHVGPID